MKRVAAILLVTGALLAPIPTAAQKSEVEALILLARAVPAEIAADTLIKLATSDKRLSRTSRIALLDEAWALADNAQEPNKKPLVPGVDPASRAGWLSRGFLLDLDRLSLKSRMLIGLVRDEPVRARQMFQTIAVDVPPLTCRDELAYDFDAYYQTAALIAAQAFTDEERADGGKIAFLENVVYGMRSPSQVPSMANMLSELESNDDLVRLSGVFALMLRGVAGDDRSFTYTMRWAPSRDALEKLALELKERGIQADMVVDAYRSYLVKHLTGRRCAATDGGRLPGDELVERFNTTLRRGGYASASEILPITPADRKPISIESVRQTPPSQLRSTANQIGAAVDRALNSRQMTIVTRRGNRTTVILSGRSTMRASDIVSNGRTSVRPLTHDFLLQVQGLKDRLAVWRPTAKGDPEEYFQLKSGLYQSLFTVDPFGPFGDEVVSDYVTLLAQQDIDRQSRVGWYVRVHDLLETANAYGAEVAGAVRERMTFSGHPTLKAIVALTNATSGPR